MTWKRRLPPSTINWRAAAASSAWAAYLPATKLLLPHILRAFHEQLPQTCIRIVEGNVAGMTAAVLDGSGGFRRDAAGRRRTKTWLSMPC